LKVVACVSKEHWTARRSDALIDDDNDFVWYVCVRYGKRVTDLRDIQQQAYQTA